MVILVLFSRHFFFSLSQQVIFIYNTKLIHCFISIMFENFQFYQKQNENKQSKQDKLSYIHLYRTNFIPQPLHFLFPKK